MKFAKILCFISLSLLFLSAASFFGYHLYSDIATDLYLSTSSTSLASSPAPSTSVETSPVITTASATTATTTSAYDASSILSFSVLVPHPRESKYEGMPNDLSVIEGMSWLWRAESGALPMIIPLMIDNRGDQEYTVFARIFCYTEYDALLETLDSFVFPCPVDGMTTISVSAPDADHYSVSLFIVDE